MENARYKILGDYYKQQDIIKIIALKNFLEIGLTRKESALQIGISEYQAYILLRYGENRFSDSIKKKVKERDQNKCTKCGEKNKLLHIHHIGDPTNQSLSNLTTLCNSCHGKERKGKKYIIKGK